MEAEGIRTAGDVLGPSLEVGIICLSFTLEAITEKYYRGRLHFRFIVSYKTTLHFYA